MINPLGGSLREWTRRSELTLGTLTNPVGGAGPLPAGGVDAVSRPKTFWSVDHVSFEAVAAYADEKLAPKPAARAREHFKACRECAEHLHTQLQARSALRHAAGVQVPGRLLGTLSAIPTYAAKRSAQ